MLILAAVPDIQLHKLRRAAAARFSLARALTWGEALATIRTRPVGSGNSRGASSGATGGCGRAETTTPGEGNSRPSGIL